MEQVETRTHLVDELTRTERTALMFEYRAEGWRSVTASEQKHLAADTTFQTAWVFTLGNHENE